MEEREGELVVFSDDGSRLAVCSLDGELKIWSSDTRTLVSRFTPEEARGAAVASAAWSRVSFLVASLPPRSNCPPPMV